MKIKKMPSKKTLEAYLDNKEPIKVYFDIKKGRFVWDERFKNEKNKTNTG